MKKKISEQSELCSDMVAEMKRFELLRRGTPDLPHFECGPFNHLGTSPYISVCFILKKFLERKAGENTKKYSIFDSENPYKQRVFRRTKRPSNRKISSQSRYDHFDTSPYLSNKYIFYLFFFYLSSILIYLKSYILTILC